MNERLFPGLLILLDFLAAVVYLAKGDWKHGVYWLAAMTLTICVTI